MALNFKDVHNRLIDIPVVLLWYCIFQMWQWCWLSQVTLQTSRIGSCQLVICPYHQHQGCHLNWTDHPPLGMEDLWFHWSAGKLKIIIIATPPLSTVKFILSGGLISLHGLEHHFELFQTLFHFQVVPLNNYKTSCFVIHVHCFWLSLFQMLFWVIWNYFSW